MSQRADSPADARRRDDNRIDAGLIERVAKRDRQALTELYRRYYHPLLRFTQRITGDLEAAQECINDVMLVVWDKASTFGGRSRVSTWIMGIAYRKALKALRRSSIWGFRFKAADWAESVEPVTTGGEHTEQLALEDLLYRGMRMLNPKQRAVVELTYFYGYSYEEISTIVGCPVNTVKTRMFHARAALRDVLPALGKDDLEES